MCLGIMRQARLHNIINNRKDSGLFIYNSGPYITYLEPRIKLGGRLQNRLENCFYNIMRKYRNDQP